MRYRPEIDGLRALAVLPVLFFHAAVPGFAGGFIGVDIFFVISGYLIARLIDHEREAGRFSLAGFYERRARRLLPALFLVMLACIPLAWLLLLPDDLESFGQSLVATALMANNVLLWLTSGYWDTSVEFKPLMHAWSLGVEEQFYLLFPPLALGLARLGPRRRIALAGLLVGVGLALALAWGRHDDRAAFLLLPTRAWQLLLGASCAWAAAAGWPARRREALAAAGLGLIALALLLPPAGGAFPSPAALAACAGTALLLSHADAGAGVGRALALRPLVAIGLASYSLYLWHQPALAFLRVASLEEPPLWQALAVLAVAALLAAFSWRFVERPLRDRARVPLRPFAVAAAVAALLLVATGLLLHWSFRAGAPLRVAHDTEGVGRWAVARYNDQPLRYLDQPFTDAGGRRVLVAGNSFARDFINAGLENGYFTGSQLSYTRGGLSCISAAAEMAGGLAQRLAQADVVVLGYDSVHPQCWANDLARLRALGVRRLVVIGVKDFGWNLSAAARLPLAERLRWRARPQPAIVQANRADRALVGDAMFVDVLALLSDGEGRVPVFTPEGRLVTGDRRHFTPEGARYLGSLIFAHPLLRDLR